MSEPKKYQAFISYRHLPLDKAVAIRLQTLLEKLTPPRGTVCKNSRKITRIFRDESELPTSGDLGMDIITALENSDFLVVLCSPKLKLSKWCLREIEYFKELNGGRINRILPILIDGEPSESFPEALKVDINKDGEQVEVEPLACNITAGGDIKATLKLLNKEYLRIAAPLLGCGFDDLYRRHRRRKIRQITTFSVASVATVFIVSLLLILQMRDVVESRDAMFAELSAGAYSAGRISCAVDYAMLALAPRTLFMPGFNPRAEKALATALGVYNFAGGFRPKSSVAIPASAQSVAISPGGEHAAIVADFQVHIIHIDSSEIIVTLDTTPSAMAEARFLDDSILIFAGQEGLTAFDIVASEAIWTGEPATAIAISQDRCTIAGINRRETHATVYNAQGEIITVIDFDGSHQRVTYHDIFANPGRNLLELNQDGSWLAVSFYDSDLTLFDLNGSSILIPYTYEFEEFAGGFNGNIFVFSGSGRRLFSELRALSLYTSQNYIIHYTQYPLTTRVYNNQIFVVEMNFLFEKDIFTGEQIIVAHTAMDARITDFSVTGAHIIISTDQGHIKIFDRAGNQLSTYTPGISKDFILIAEEHAIAASRNSGDVMLLQHQNRDHAIIFSYNPVYAHEELRMNTAGTRVMRYSPRHFRLYSIDEGLIVETDIPGGDVWNMQFSHASGNLAVIHRNEALRIYSGENGGILFEQTGLRSVFFAGYGISILDESGTLSLICMDSATAIVTYQAQGNSAIYAGMTIDSNFMGQREPIGATRHDGGYLFVLCNGNVGTVYDHVGRRQFDVTTGNFTEAFFTDSAVVIAPMHGIPVAYSLRSGSVIQTLEQDGYLTGVNQIGDFVVIEYISAEGYRFGILHNDRFEPIAYLPWLTDVNPEKMQLLFDHRLGNVWYSAVYSLDELIELTKF